jgi:hypothetical protein
VCPDCGSEHTSVALTAGDVLNLGGSGDLSVKFAITPSDHERNTRRRWEEARTLLNEVKTPLTQPVDLAILRAQHDLHTVLADIWSLREATRADGVSGANVEAAIDGSPTMGLAHDLGNLAKHGQLDRNGRSGGRPTFGPPQAESGSVGTPTTFVQSA